MHPADLEPLVLPVKLDHLVRLDRAAILAARDSPAGRAFPEALELQVHRDCADLTGLPGSLEHEDQAAPLDCQDLQVSSSQHSSWPTLLGLSLP